MDPAIFPAHSSRFSNPSALLLKISSFQYSTPLKLKPWRSVTHCRHQFQQLMSFLRFAKSFHSAYTSYWMPLIFLICGYLQATHISNFTVWHLFFQRSFCFLTGMLQNHLLLPHLLCYIFHSMHNQLLLLLFDQDLIFYYLVY